MIKNIGNTILSYGHWLANNPISKRSERVIALQNYLNHVYSKNVNKTPYQNDNELNKGLKIDRLIKINGRRMDD